MNDGSDPGQLADDAAGPPGPDPSTQHTRRAILERVSPGLIVDLFVEGTALGTGLAEAGYTYVGICDRARTRQALERAGLRALLLGDVGDLERLRAILDTLGPIQAFCVRHLDARLSEHDRLLTLLSGYARAHGGIMLVIATPNAGNRDFALRLLAGQYPDTMVDAVQSPELARIYTGRHLSMLMEQTGWQLVARYDLFEDAARPRPSSSLLGAPTLVGDFLRSINDRFSPDAEVDHFVWALTPSEMDAAAVQAPPVDGPLVSVLVRTQGRRNELFVEALASIAAQTSDEYEVIVCFHNPGDTIGERQAGIWHIVSQFREPLHGKIRVIETHEYGRGAPLNALLESAHGVYLSFLDDDDLLFDHHVDAIKRGIEQHGTSVLFQTFAAQRLLGPAQAGQAPTSTADPKAGYPYTVIAMSVPWARPLDLIQQHYENMVPICSLAIPRALICQTSLRFRTDIDLGEDWIFWMDVFQLLRVVILPEVTAVVNHWNDLVTNAMRRPDLAPLWQQLRDARYAELAKMPLLLDGQVRMRLMEYGQQAEVLAHLREEIAKRDARLQTIYASRLWRFGRMTWSLRHAVEQALGSLRRGLKER